MEDGGARDANALIPNRYVLGSRSHPDRISVPWNRTQILNAAAPRGGALLIHGLSDSPYSMRAIAERLNAGGFHTLSLRMQGHGKVPGGLTNTTWEDWSAAVRMGARHVRDRIGPDGPLVLVGYSNGGALITKYALDALEDASLPPPSKLILVSAMIGVSPAARLAGAISLLGPLVPKARWIDVVPEYNPFSNSFPANAPHRPRTGALNTQLLRAGERAGSKMRPCWRFTDGRRRWPAAVVDDLLRPPGRAGWSWPIPPPGRHRCVHEARRDPAAIDRRAAPVARSRS